ncbi:Transcriptional regulatory protein ompR [Candidatus Burkholderia humilis]|nr:Transcriptional regulatory protein ompR [Candidatus Burkholderia humilis]
METNDHVLIVDDNRGIRELLATYLEKQGMRVTLTASGRQMRAALEQGAPDLIVLDLILPGEDGLELCRELRAGKFRTVPVLMLTARNEEADRILDLEMGADDYLPKPFAVRELYARIRSVLRRTRMLPPGMQVSETAQMLGFGDWKLDTTARHLLDAEGTMVSLSGTEYRLLRVFLDHPQRVLTRDQLLNLTQGRQADPFDRSIDLLVSCLRQHLRDEPREPRYIKTLRSEGYVFGGRDADCRRSMIRLPRTLFARLALILVIGLAIAQAASFWLTVTEINCHREVRTRIVAGQ